MYPKSNVKAACFLRGANVSRRFLQYGKVEEATVIMDREDPGLLAVLLTRAHLRAQVKEKTWFFRMIQQIARCWEGRVVKGSTSFSFSCRLLPLLSSFLFLPIAWLSQALTT
jgi:hypothetical protein